MNAATSIDNQSVSSVTQASLRQHIGMVTQDTSLLHRSIRENIAYGVRNATDEQVWAAIEKADATDFIKTLEDANGGKALDAQVGERGIKLSGGQRQAVSLLMAALNPMKLLLLDEHTAALDPKTAQFILELTQEIVAEQKLTALMVTHSMKQALAICLSK